jgi:hypothetical protein
MESNVMESTVIVSFERNSRAAIMANQDRPDGRLYCTIDTEEWFLQNGNDLVKLSDIKVLETEQNRLDILVPLPRKFYMVEQTNSLWFVTSNFSWIQLTGLADLAMHIIDQNAHASLFEQKLGRTETAVNSVKWGGMRFEWDADNGYLSFFTAEFDKANGLNDAGNNDLSTDQLTLEEV